MTAPDRTSTPPIPRPPRGGGRHHENILSLGSMLSGPTRLSPTCLPMGLTSHRPGTQFFNVYPLFHTAALYNGFRKDEPEKRALILSRDAYTARRPMALSSGLLTFSLPGHAQAADSHGLDFAASGLTYWSNDTGGWSICPRSTSRAQAAAGSFDARANVGGYDDYPELYTRWFQYATFLPIMRAHGSRVQTSMVVRKRAEPILEKYLRLRYQLMPYIYSLGTTRG